MYNIEIDNKWNQRWINDKRFKFDPESDKPVFVIDTPPPFTTGELHMGHVYWVTYADSLARYMRLKGYNVLYPQGWDAKGFPTEIAVEKKYGRSLSRDEFYKRCEEISSQNIKLMKDQMRQLGATFDESYEYNTLSKDYIRKVQLSLIYMFNKGLIYKAMHPVDWCPHCVSSIAKAEEEDLEEETDLNYISFSLEDNKELIIATTRPELMHACVAIAVNPEDSRYKDYIGKDVIIPLYNRKVKIIADEIVDKEFGTGAEMICTYGDKNDLIIVKKHNLNFIDALTEDGRIKNSGLYDNLTAQDARKKIIEELKAKGLLKKVEKIKHSVRIHDRCKTKIELLNREQMFIKIKEFIPKIKEVAASIRWIPEHLIHRLNNWADSLEWDWNISRNRIFGTPLPFWICNNCKNIIPAAEEQLPVNPIVDKPPVERCPICNSNDIIPETSTADVWIDSSITPLIISGWPDSKLFDRLYPASIRIQGTDIIRTWAFYTIFRSSFISGDKPFESLLIHGMILGPDGRQMHKSWGNGVYPSELLQKYPVDAIRLWVALSGSIGSDKIFSYKDMEYAKRFLNKLENSINFISRFIKGFDKDENSIKDEFNLFDIAILSKFNDIVEIVERAYDSYDINTAMTQLVNFYWHDFCDYYIENIKHRVYNDSRDKDAAVFTLRYIANNSLILFAPVIPHIVEELYTTVFERSVFDQSLPKFVENREELTYAINGIVFRSAEIEVPIESIGDALNSIISAVRQAKTKNKISLNEPIKSVNIKANEELIRYIELVKDDIAKICKSNNVNIEKGEGLNVSIEL
ncbi:MAG: valine--tRNA ligase [Candidatus Micrarchaeota archaeon]|nr:MAG: valine--tRNA ligase [Candidatus Micrarchaeota archaeon]